MARTVSGGIVLEYLKKYSTWPNRTLARKIWEENPKVFTGIEQVRSSVRQYKGMYGKRNRKLVKNNMYYDRNPAVDDIAMPKSEIKEWSPYHVPDQFQKTLMLSDIHIPYHDIEAIKTSVEFGKKENIDSLLLNGDFIDFYQLSTFCKDPRLVTAKEELERANWMLDYFEEKLNVPIILKLGNHEERWDRYIQLHAPAILGMDGQNLASQLMSKERGLVLVAEQRRVCYGKLAVLHGHEYGKGFVGSPVNPARSLFLKAKAHAIAGHEHMSSSHSETNIIGDVITTWSVGCLCDLHPEYRRMNKWNLGFAILEKDSSGKFRVNNYKIISNSIYPA